MKNKSMLARQIYSKAVGNAIWLMRKKYFHRSQKSFGKLCGVSQKTISNWEKTEDFKNFNLKSLFNLAWAIGVYPSDILRYVEAYLDERFPGMFDRFKKSRRFSESARNRWMKDKDSRAGILFEVLYQTLRILREKDPKEITDEDLKNIRIILKKYA